VNTTTHTRILTQVLDEYPRLVVALVQRDHAAIYEAEQRRATEEAAIDSDVPGHHDQGGWAQARFQRHTEVHVQRHLHQVADELGKLFHERPFRRLAIGGTEETTKELINMLPDPVRRTLIGTFHVDVKHASDEAVLDQARALHREHERQTEQELVANLADAAESGGKGAIGIAPTLEAVRDGRVETLVLADGITVEGSACVSCDYFAAERFDRCPACGAEGEPAPDIIDRALERAFLSGARIESAFGEASEWLIARGGLGAVLRY
jgi:peptide chain release factor subunit 1